MNTIKCLSYKTLPSQTDDIKDVILEVITDHNAVNKSNFSYEASTDSEGEKTVWSVTGKANNDEDFSFRVVEERREGELSYEPLIAFEAGSSEEGLFYNIFSAVVDAGGFGNEPVHNRL